MDEQQNMFPKPEGDMVSVADRVVALFKERAAVKEKLEVQSRSLCGLLKKAKLPGIRHGGYVIKVNHTPEADKLQLKEDKDEPKGKVGKRGRR